MYRELRPIVAKADVLIAELAALLQSGPIVRIVHRFHEAGTYCRVGEEVWAVNLVHRGHEIPLRLSLALRLLVNYLAETRHVPQSAAQIAAGINRASFYTSHGKNSGVVSRRKISRSAVKEYVKRIRKAFNFGFREIALNLNSKSVLVSRITMGNETHYQLRAAIEWVHFGDDCARAASV
jgi:hypothetical protein